MKTENSNKTPPPVTLRYFHYAATEWAEKGFDTAEAAIAWLINESANAYADELFCLFDSERRKFIPTPAQIQAGERRAETERKAQRNSASLQLTGSTLTEAATPGEFVNIYDTSKKYEIIYADPPWNYADKNCAGAAAAQYSTMKLDELAALPIPQIAAKNCVLFMWATYPKLEDAQALIKAWGFKYKSIAFQWVKLNKAADKEKLLHALQNSDSLEAALQKICFFGLGRWTRGNTEPCLIAIKGKPARVSPGVGQLIFAPLGRHSAKPPETRNKIIELTGGGMQRIELFARQHAPGFDCWGNEV